MIRRRAKLTYGGNPSVNPPVAPSVKNGWILGWWVNTDPVTKQQNMQFAWEDGQDRTFSVADLDYGGTNSPVWTFEDGQPDPLPTVD